MGYAGSSARESVDASRVWLPGIIARVAACLPNNDVACILRLVSKQASTTLRLPEHTRVVLSRPVPTDTFGAHWSAPDACRGLTLAQGHKLIFLTAASGVVANLEAAVAAAGCELSADLIAEAGQHAASAGQLDSCRWLLDPVRAPPEFDWAAFCESAGEGGHKHIINWSLTAGAEACVNTPRYFHGYHYGAVASAAVGAARGGHVELLDCLITERPADFEHLQKTVLLEAIARGCDLPTLARLWADPGGSGFVNEVSQSLILSAAISSPTPDWQAKAEWLLEQGHCRLSKVARGCAHGSAARNCGDGSLERFAWADSRCADPGPPDASALTDAIEKNNLAAVRYILGRGLLLSPSVDVSEAARKGHLAILQTLLAAPGEPVDVGECARAAASGAQLGVLEWLVETYGAERLGGFSDELESEGAASGSVEVLAWLRERGCGFGSSAAWSEAASAGCEAALELLEAYGCPHPTEGKPYTNAASNGDLRTLSVLSRLGLPFGAADTFALSVSNSDPWGGVQALQWLLDRGCPVDWDAAMGAAQEEDVPEGVREWVKAQWDARH